MAMLISRENPQILSVQSLEAHQHSAKKVPENVNEILTEAYLRKAFLVQQHDIPAELRVNTDQTQVVYQHGSEKTLAEKNLKQVPTT